MLIECQECTKEYSDKASACPECANPTPSSVQPEIKTIPSNPRLYKYTAQIKGFLGSLVFGTIIWIFIGVVFLETKEYQFLMTAIVYFPAFYIRKENTRIDQALTVALWLLMSIATY